MTKNSKNHDESPDKHYTFSMTSVSSRTKKTEPTPKVLWEQEIFFNISQTLSERFRPLDKNVN